MLIRLALITVALSSFLFARPQQSGQGGCELVPAFDVNAVDENDRMGFIDSSGRLVIGFHYYSAEEFHSGLAVVRLARDGQDGYIDVQGKHVLETSSRVHG